MPFVEEEEKTSSNRFFAPKKNVLSVEMLFRQEEVQDISIEDHIGLAIKCASQYAPDHPLDSEEYSIALIGLWHAAETYDPHINDKFSSYAWKCMRNRILDSYKFNSRKKRNIPLVQMPENFDIPEEQLEDLLDDLRDLDLNEILNFDDPEEGKHQRDKQMLKMRFLENKSWQEIGDCYDMTKAGARHCVFSLIDKIRSSI